VVVDVNVVVVAAVFFVLFLRQWMFGTVRDRN
jgi:hypothetical protein